MQKDQQEIEEKCFIVVQEITNLINMHYLNSLVILFKNNVSEEEIANVVQLATKDLQKRLVDIKNLGERLLRQNKKSAAKFLLTSFQSDLQHLFTYYLSEGGLHDYVTSNWKGVYRTLKFQKSSPRFFYNAEKVALKVDQKDFTMAAIGNCKKVLNQLWSLAWETLRAFEAQFNDSISGKKLAGKKKKRPSMDEIYLPSLLIKDLETLKNLDCIKWQSSTNKWKWEKEMHELARYYRRALKKKRFVGTYKNSERGAAFLEFFFIEETKANLDFFSDYYYKKRIFGQPDFPL